MVHLHSLVTVGAAHRSSWATFGRPPDAFSGGEAQAAAVASPEAGPTADAAAAVAPSAAVVAPAELPGQPNLRVPQPRTRATAVPLVAAAASAAEALAPASCTSSSRDRSWLGIGCSSSSRLGPAARKVARGQARGVGSSCGHQTGHGSRIHIDSSHEISKANKDWGLLSQHLSGNGCRRWDTRWICLYDMHTACPKARHVHTNTPQRPAPNPLSSVFTSQ